MTTFPPPASFGYTTAQSVRKSASALAIDGRCHEVLEGREEIEAAQLASTPIIEAKHRGSSLGWIAAVVIASLAAGAVGYFADGRSDETTDPWQFSVTFEPDQELEIAGNSMLAFAPDALSLVVTGRENGKQMLFRRQLQEKSFEAIPGTEDGSSPFFSPDGQWIGFTGGGRLMKVPAEGGRPFVLAESRGAGGACWLPGDMLIFAPIYSDGLFRISAQGGDAERLTTPDREAGELGHWWPEPLPGGKKVLFTAFRTPVDRSRIGMLDLGSLEISWLVDSGFSGRYVSTGHLVFARGKRLFAHAFDPESSKVVGPAVPLLDDLLVSATGGTAAFSVSSLGTLAYVSESHGDPKRELVWLDRDGNARAAAKERHRFMSVSLSPDGSKAAVTIQEESQDLWIYSLERGTLSRLTSGSDTEFDPVWSIDGRELFYVLDSPPFEPHRISVSSPDSGRKIWDEKSEIDTNSIAVAPDGLWLAFVQSELTSGQNIYSRPLDNSEPARAFRGSRADERWPSFSPDGRWLVYSSNETGRDEIYVEEFPGPGERFQISADGGTEPLWSPDGEEIFYRHDNAIHIVELRLGDPHNFDEPRKLFTYSVGRSTDNTYRTYAVSADGESILAVSILSSIPSWACPHARLAARGGSQASARASSFPADQGAKPLEYG